MERRARIRNEAEENNFAGNEQSEIGSKIVNASVETNEHRLTAYITQATKETEVLVSETACWRTTTTTEKP